ncbi:hypothetical protein QR98_0052660 [Sarcoptes scabiei]|uniref:Uncharacterized protein n=1 Tax=Sarcoptes scabiei TaxID=52283 RepID=A0A132A785_SARSC|nr:hypothetical protein QR98_0052660 [Sarcoptes scabiei]
MQKIIDKKTIDPNKIKKLISQINGTNSIVINLRFYRKIVKQHKHIVTISTTTTTTTYDNNNNNNNHFGECYVNSAELYN